MKQRLLTLSLAFLMALALVSPAYADMIWEPDDSFYESHRDECTYVGRSYQLAGYDGKVTVFTAPGGAVKTTLNNGEQCIVQFTWTGNGVTWGYWLSDSDTEGWVPMDDLSLVYDCQQFLEDHAREITDLGTIQADFTRAQRYEYPNGTTNWMLEERREFLPFSEAFSKLYTDENGLRWGYCGYYLGARNFWVCLDDPENENLNTGIVPVSPSPAQLRGSATVTDGPSLMWAAAALVAAVAAVTAVLIWRLKKREK